MSPAGRGAGDYSSRDAKERGGAVGGSGRPLPALSAPRCSPGVAVSAPGAAVPWLLVGTRCPSAPRPRAAGRGGKGGRLPRGGAGPVQDRGCTKTYRACLNHTMMEELIQGDQPIPRDTVPAKLCCDHITTTNLVEVLSSLVALTDPQEGKLTQSQEKALNSVGVWKTALGAVPGPAPKTSVE